MFSQEDDSVVVIKYDSIKFVNGTKQAAKILEISDKNVKYKNPLDLNGPTFSVRKKDVAGFVFVDGCLDLKQQGFENCVKDPNADLVKDNDFKNKLISVDLFQLTIRHVQLNFDYFFKNKKNGISFYGNFGVLAPTYYKTYQHWETEWLFSGKMYKKYHFGVDFKVFPSKHRKLNYFYSLGLDAGRVFVREEELVLSSVVHSPMGGYYYVPQHYIDNYYKGLYSSFRYNNGFLWRITKSLYMHGGIVLGVNYYRYHSKTEDKDINLFLPKVLGNVSLGFAF